MRRKGIKLTIRQVESAGRQIFAEPVFGASMLEFDHYRRLATAFGDRGSRGGIPILFQKNAAAINAFETARQDLVRYSRAYPFHRGRLGCAVGEHDPCTKASRAWRRRAAAACRPGPYCPWR